MWTKLQILALTIALGAIEAFAQAPPDTEIFLAKLDGDRVDRAVPVNLTGRKGYDNQPRFLGDGDQLLYTAIDGEQADIWIVDLATLERRRVTETPESEYSPTPIPGEDAISVVRVEADETQRLWRFPLAGGEPDLLLPDVKPVGYHAWSGTEDLVLFVLGEPITLQHARRGDGPGKILLENVGRALHPVPGSRQIAFVHKPSEAEWTIRTVDVATGELATVLATRPEREDFAWSPSGKLWMGDGSALYVADPKGDGGWRQVADFSPFGLSEITRIAIHPKETSIAFVAVAARWQ